MCRARDKENHTRGAREDPPSSAAVSSGSRIPAACHSKSVSKSERSMLECVTAGRLLFSGDLPEVWHAAAKIFRPPAATLV